MVVRLLFNLRRPQSRTTTTTLEEQNHLERTKYCANSIIITLKATTVTDTHFITKR